MHGLYWLKSVSRRLLSVNLYWRTLYSACSSVCPLVGWYSCSKDWCVFVCSYLLCLIGSVFVLALKCLCESDTLCLYSSYAYTRGEMSDGPGHWFNPNVHPHWLIPHMFSSWQFSVIPVSKATSNGGLLQRCMATFQRFRVLQTFNNRNTPHPLFKPTTCRTFLKSISELHAHEIHKKNEKVRNVKLHSRFLFIPFHALAAFFAPHIHLVCDNDGTCKWWRLEDGHWV